MAEHGERLSATIGAPADRMRVILSLSQKATTLGQAVSALQVRLLSITDPVEYNTVANEIPPAQAEEYRCSAREAAINYNQPFNDPGQAATNALLAAINTVNRSMAPTAAIANLIQAVNGLVQTFPAANT
jgi:hypothetical protein